MTAAGKKQFIKELTRNVSIEILGDVERMPKEWDGHELRQLIADKFADAASMSKTISDKRSQRRRDYENEKLVRNL